MATTDGGGGNQIYTRGPESLVQRAGTILAGTVSSYARHVQETSQPPGPGAMPIKWIVRGGIENPRALYGRSAGPIAFSRTEHSVLISAPDNQEEWEAEYGDLQPNGEAVLFLSGDPAHPTIKALPSGIGERDLAALVRDIVAIQQLDHPSKESAWLAYLETAPVDEGRRAALRSLVQLEADWDHLGPALDRFLANPALSETMPAFAFGIVVFGVTGGRWAESQGSVVAFLCRHFTSEGRPRLELSYVQNLKLMLRYTMAEARRAATEPLRRSIADCLRRREASASASPELAMQYQQIRASFPGLL